jgi:uncharacterized protein with ParB-like and HNH nuclease domain
MNHLQTVQEIFQGRLYTVPDYQRGYAWEELQWQDLWDDLEILDKDHDHYTGTLVIHPTQPDTLISDDDGTGYTEFNIVDGQQRLATLSILLNEIILQFKQLGNEARAISMKKNFIATTKNGDLYPKLRLNRDTNVFYKEVVVGLKSVAPKIKSEERLRDATKFFRECLEEQKRLQGCAYPEWLDVIRTKIVSKMKLTVYVVPSASDVGVIFEAMNNRGKKLTELEKVKNYLLYASAKLRDCGGEGLAEDINTAWKNIHEMIMEYGVSDKAEDQLLRFNWIVTHNYRTKEWNGSNSIKENFCLKKYSGRGEQLRDDIREYISLLKQSCKAFCDINNPEKDRAFDHIGDRKLRKEIIRYSSRLVRLGTTSAFTPMLIASRLKDDAPEQYLRLLDICEKYAFRVFRMRERRANTGQPAFYRAAFDYFSGECDFQHMYDTVHRLLTRYCSKSVYEESFESPGGDWYNWRGSRYLLFEYELHKRNKAGAESCEWKHFQEKDKKDTVEHILPQTPNKPYWNKHWSKKQIKEVTHDIGNLVLTLDNSSYGNKSFGEKKGSRGSGEVCYANSSLLSESELCRYEDWNYDSFLDRREELVEWMKGYWYIEDYVSDQDYAEFDEESDDESELF